MSLVYYPDSNPGITRRRRGRGFSYMSPEGDRITDKAERARLTALAVPPAYHDVWMAPLANAHLLATGRDDRGRKQYRYHPDWTAARDQTKFDMLPRVGAALPGLRRWIAENLKGTPGSQSTAIAAVLALIDRSAMRPGNVSYAEENGSYGALTLEKQHLTIDGNRIALDYTAKGGTRVREDLVGARLARVLHKSADLPGPRLFDYRTEEGGFAPLRSEHVAEVLDAVTAGSITPKSVRTWVGTLAAFLVARSDGPEVTITDMAKAASERLHNTPTVARNSYIHPSVIKLSGDTGQHAGEIEDDGPAELREGEAALLRFLS